jgi:replicative DNA helicase
MREGKPRPRPSSPSPSSSIPREVPKSKALEQAVLGAALSGEEAAAQVLTLSGEDFYWPGHRRIFQALQALAREGKPIDVVLVASYLEERGELAQVGGRAYLSDLLSQVVTLEALPAYIQQLRRKTLGRALYLKAAEIADLSLDSQGLDSPELLQQAQLKLAELQGLLLKQERVADPLDFLKEIEARALHRTVPGVRTGFSALDRLVGTLAPGDMIILAGRPGSGKTSLALSMLWNAAREGKRGVFFSLEMAAGAIWERLLAIATRVKLRRIRGGELTESELAQLRAQAEALRGQVLVAEDFGATLQSLRQTLRDLYERWKPDLAVVDYVQLLGYTAKEAQTSRSQELAMVSRG